MAKLIKQKKVKVKAIEPYWDAIVAVWFKFCVDYKGDKPSFDGSAPRDLKSIMKQLRERAEEKGIEWSELAAVTRLSKFLEVANTYKYLNEHWLLSNINRQKDIIFFDISKQYSQNKK